MKGKVFFLFRSFLVTCFIDSETNETRPSFESASLSPLCCVKETSLTSDVFFSCRFDSMEPPLQTDKWMWFGRIVWSIRQRKRRQDNQWSSRSPSRIRFCYLWLWRGGQESLEGRRQPCTQRKETQCCHRCQETTNWKSRSVYQEKISL